MNGPPPIGAGVKDDGQATRILHKRGEGTGESVQEATNGSTTLTDPAMGAGP